MHTQRLHDERRTVAHLGCAERFSLIPLDLDTIFGCHISEQTAVGAIPERMTSDGDRITCFDAVGVDAAL